MAGVAYFISGHKQARLSRVWYYSELIFSTAGGGVPCGSRGTSPIHHHSVFLAFMARLWQKVHLPGKCAVHTPVTQRQTTRQRLTNAAEINKQS